MHCSIVGHSGARPDLDAGEALVLHCVFDNTGASLAKVALETSIVGSAPARSPAQEIAAPGTRRSMFRSRFRASCAIDSPVEIAASAQDRKA